MNSDINQKEFVALSACCMMLTALGIDIMLPAFGDVRKHFNLSERSAETAYIVTFFFLGQISQIFFGSLSDRYGRLLILRLGFPFYILGGVAATFAPDMPIMYLARFIAGMGASAVFMTTIAGVRDRFEGDAMARTMSFIFTIFLFTPVIAPFLGAAILNISGWRAVFLFPPLFAMGVFIWSLRLKESLPEAQRSRKGITTVLSDLGKVIGNKQFVRYTLITTLLFAGISSYVSSSEHIIADIYNRPNLFTIVFATIGSVMALGALTNAKLNAKYGAERTIKGLLIAYVGIALLLLIGTALQPEPPGLLFFFSCIALLLGINLAVEPNSSSLALKDMGSMAGLASSLYGTCFFFVGALLGSLISALLRTSVLPMAVSYLIIGLTTFILARNDNSRSDS